MTVGFCLLTSCLLFSGVNYTYNDEIVVPIIENTLEEKDLKVS